MTSETLLANVLPENLARVLPYYLGDATPTRIESVSTGHIHNSWRVDFTPQDSASTSSTNHTPLHTHTSLFLQQLNTTVFPRPEAVMHNVLTVTSFLKDMLAGSPYDSLVLVPTTFGDPYIRIDETWWRAFEFKTGLVSHHTLSSPDMAYEAGKAFASFARQLEGVNPATLQMPIERFHSLSWRAEQLKNAVLTLPNRCESVTHLKTFMDEIRPLIRDAEDFIQRLQPLEKAWITGKLPTRITHNDSKLNNLMFDHNGKARCVVDLDTVMPGIVHFDIGDSLRSMSVSAAEDDPNSSQLRIQEEVVNRYVEGYLERDWLTAAEIKYIPYAAPYMACIMGVRFLTDYAEGNRYFKVDYPSHNFVRAENQLTLTRLFLERITLT